MSFLCFLLGIATARKLCGREKLSSPDSESGEVYSNNTSVNTLTHIQERSLSVDRFTSTLSPLHDETNTTPNIPQKSETTNAPMLSQIVEEKMMRIDFA